MRGPLISGGAADDDDDDGDDDVDDVDDVDDRVIRACCWSSLCFCCSSSICFWALMRSQQGRLALRHGSEANYSHARITTPRVQE